MKHTLNISKSTMKFLSKYILFILILTVSACRKYENFVPYNDQEAAAVSADDFFMATQEAGEFFTINTDETEVVSITTDKGTILDIVPQSFLDGQNQPVSGLIDIEIIEVLDKGEMMIYDKPNALHLSDALLNSVGQIFIRATQDDLELKLQGTEAISIKIPSTALDENMRAYTSHREGKANYWIEDEGNITFDPDFGYEIKAFTLGWYNCASPLVSSELTSVCLNLPAQYTSRNTLAYVAYEGINGISRIYGDVIDETFCNQLPNGVKAQLIIISVQGKDNYYFDIQDITITDNLNINPNPTPSNLQGIVDFLAAL